MKIKNVMSIWPDGSDAHWVMTLENESTFSITMATAHRLIDEFSLKNLNPSGQFDESDNTINTFEPLPAPKLPILNTIPNTDNKCLNCRHWRDKAWTNKGWGICDNPKNEVRIPGVKNMLGLFGSENEWVANEIENGLRYPEDFGCIFFEPK